MKTTFFILAALAMSCLSCDLGISPSNLSTIEVLLAEEGGLATATNGNYALFKDVLPFRGQEAGNLNNDYTRHLYQMGEFSSDNVMYTQFSSDPLYLVFTRGHFPAMENSAYFWFIAYRMMLGTNLIIGNVEPGVDAETDQLLGENYFLRALTTHDLLKFFAKPYSHGTNNPGIVLRTSLAEENNKARATVGESYDQLVSDLLEAESLMTEGNDRGVQFASKLAAQALLSRVYLEMEDNAKAIEYADKVIANPAVRLATNVEYLDNFANSSSSSESIFVISFTLIDHRAKNGSIGSMYYDDGNNNGWGEVFASESYLDIIRANPEDIRNELVLSIPGFPAINKSGFPIHYVTKFSGQNGVVNLCSPQYLRLSEIYLNRAEANAKSGNEAKALQDVNLIRARAGYTGDKLYSAGNLGGRTALEVVLDERRIELAFEGHRSTDLVRNKVDLTRDYPGIHQENGDTRVTIPWDDARSIFFVPNSEVITNPLIEQNP